MIYLEKSVIDETIGEFIDSGFEEFSNENGVVCGYEDFCYTVKDEGRLIAILKGNAYYNEVHIGELLIIPGYRRHGIGKMLIEQVEKDFAGKGYENINLTTFGFQAPEFYRKMGYSIEHIRKSSNDKLTKYFFVKELSS